MVHELKCDHCGEVEFKAFSIWCFDGRTAAVGPYTGNKSGMVAHRGDNWDGFDPIAPKLPVEDEFSLTPAGWDKLTKLLASNFIHCNTCGGDSRIPTELDHRIEW